MGAVRKNGFTPVPKLPNLLGRHEAWAYKTMLYQLADPLSDLNVGLPTGDVLEMPGVEKPALEVALQQVVDWLPVDPPVASMPTNSISKEASQSRSNKSPQVVAANSRISW